MAGILIPRHGFRILLSGPAWPAARARALE